MTAGTDLRVLRAAVFTAVCVMLSAAGHVLAADETVPLWTLVTACGGVFLLVALPLAGRERSLTGIAATLAVGQVSLHTLFAYGQLTAAQTRHLTAAPGLRGPPTPAAHGTGDPVGCLQAAVHAALAMLSGPMLLGHLLAALAAGWLLRRGDAALWHLIRLSARAAEEWVTVRALRAALHCVRALLDGLPPRTGLPRVRPVTHAGRPPARTHLRHTLHRRGPPATAARIALAA